MGLVGHQVTLGRVFIQVRRVFPVSILPPMMRIYTSITDIYITVETHSVVKQHTPRFRNLALDMDKWPASHSGRYAPGAKLLGRMMCAWTRGRRKKCNSLS